MAKFFIGVRLPKELEQTCEHYRRRFKAPRTIAHITLIAPFTWEKSREELVEQLRAATRPLAPFQIAGKGIGSFGTRVIFINVNLSAELNVLQENLTRTLKNEDISHDKRPYKPHITLATRLNGQQFALYREELAGFEPEYFFTCKEITLFQLTPESRWQDCAKIPL